MSTNWFRGPGGSFCASLRFLPVMLPPGFCRFPAARALAELCTGACTSICSSTGSQRSKGCDINLSLPLKHLAQRPAPRARLLQETDLCSPPPPPPRTWCPRNRSNKRAKCKIALLGCKVTRKAMKGPQWSSLSYSPQKTGARQLYPEVAPMGQADHCPSTWVVLEFVITALQGLGDGRKADALLLTGASARVDAGCFWLQGLQHLREHSKVILL